MEDLIRRSEAIDALIECGDWYSDNDEAGRGVNQCIGVIHDLSSAQPERKTGHWITYHYISENWSECECDQCHKYAKVAYNFCPNCGSYNGGGQK